MPDLLNTLLGIDVPDSFDSIVSVLVLVFIFYCVEFILKKLASWRVGK